MIKTKRKALAGNKGQTVNNIQGEVYHQENDSVKNALEANLKNNTNPESDELEVEFEKKSQELHELVKSYDACGFGVRMNHLCKKFGVSREVLKQIRKEVLEEIKNGFDRRASQLVEDTEPCATPVTMTEALDTIYRTLKRFIIADESLLVRATLWVAHTYFIDELFVSPICLVTSPQSNCGKSLLTTVMSEMCHRSFPITANMSEAALFRIIEECTPTIGLDEADLNLQKHPEIQALLNAGHMRSTAWAFRCEPNNAYVEKFQTFCPKIISGIRSTQIRDTLTNRSIILSMRRKRKNESCECFLYSESRDLFAEIRQKIKRAAVEAIDSGAFNMRTPIDWPEWMDDGRARDNWNPLLHIALAASTEWYNRAIEASREDDETLAQIDYEKQLLTELAEIFEENEQDFFTTTELVEALLKKNSDWRYANQGQSINTRWLALRLGSYNLKSVRTRVNGTQIRVYTKHDMQKAFANYLGIDEVETISVASDEEIQNTAERVEEIKFDKAVINDCLAIVTSTKENCITAKTLADQLTEKKGAWEPKDTRNHEVTANWLKKKLTSWNVLTIRVRKGRSQIRCYRTAELTTILKNLLKNLDEELSKLQSLPVLIE